MGRSFSAGWGQALFAAAFLTVFVALHASLYDFGKMITEGALLGDDGDPRFAGAILEHWFQVLRGAAVWHSPAFDYPVQGVLGYADGFVLFVPAYAAARFAGADPYLALTLTLLVLPIVGYIALVAFFRQVMGLHLAGAALLAAAAMLSANLFEFSFWPQNLTICLVPLAMLPIGLALRRPLLGESGPPRVVAGFVGGLVAGLLAFTSFYTFWFVGLLLIVLGISLVLLLAARAGLSRRPGQADGISALSARLAAHWPALVAIVAGVMLGLLPALFVYLPVAFSHGGFPASDAIGRLRPWPTLPAATEGFMGVVDWATSAQLPMRHGGIAALALVALAAFAAFARRPPELRLLALAGLLAGVILLLSLYRHGGWTLWSVFRSIPGGSVVRDPTRLAQVLHLAALVALGAIAAWLMRRPGQPSRVALLALYGLIALIAYDGWQRIGMRKQNLPHSEYFAVIAQPVERNEACRSFFIGPEGAAAQLSRHPNLLQLYNLDAIYLAHRLGLPTLNGYSAWWPEGWALSEPVDPCYLDHVDDWIARHGLDGVCRFDYAGRHLTAYRPDPARPRCNG